MHEPGPVGAARHATIHGGRARGDRRRARQANADIAARYGGPAARERDRFDRGRARCRNSRHQRRRGCAGDGRGGVRDRRSRRVRGGSLPNPVLLCDWSDATTPEADALRIREVAPRPWIVLAGGNGVRIKVTGAPPKLIGDPVRVTVEPAPATIDASAWQHPF